MRTLSILRTPVLLGLAALLSACAGQSLNLPAANQLDHLPRQVPLNVPFHAQDAFQCGPAALAMMFNHRGIAAEPDNLTRRVYLPAREGSLQIEMVAAAREQDLLVYPLEGNIAALLTELAAGNPVLVMQNLRFDWYPQWHYAVAVGYDLNRDVLLLHTGLDKAKPQALTVFAHTWNRADRWARVIVPPDQLPATADALPYLAAAADLEQTGRLSAAETAYRTALDEWPEEPAARFGLGNTLWMQGKRERAVGEFRAITNVHPDFSPAWHNLALGLEELGHVEAANAIRVCVAEHQPPKGCTRLIPPR